jgi:hypothetical protein
MADKGQEPADAHEDDKSTSRSKSQSRRAHVMRAGSYDYSDLSGNSVYIHYAGLNPNPGFNEGFPRVTIHRPSINIKSEPKPLALSVEEFQSIQSKISKLNSEFSQLLQDETSSTSYSEEFGKRINSINKMLESM